MDILFLMVAGVMALCGAWMIADFLLWEKSGIKSLARIEGFQSKKSLWLFLPVLAFENEKGETVTTKPHRIDQMIYYVLRPQEGAITAVIHRGVDPEQSRVYGYMWVTTGALLLLPLVVALGLKAGSSVIVAQASYAVIFVMIIAGGLALMKLVQKSY